MNGDGPEIDRRSYVVDKAESLPVAGKSNSRRTSFKFHDVAHSQILRIRAEDLHVGEEDVAHFMFCSSRAILPASPLSQSRRA